MGGGGFVVSSSLVRGGLFLHVLCRRNPSVSADCWGKREAGGFFAGGMNARFMTATRFFGLGGMMARDKVTTNHLSGKVYWLIVAGRKVHEYRMVFHHAVGGPI